MRRQRWLEGRDESTAPLTRHTARVMPNGGDSFGSQSETASVLRAAYGFDEVTVGDRLRGGYANDLFRLVADGEPFVLRLKLPPVIEEDIAWEHELARLLAQRMPEVAAPIPARDGALVRIGNRVGWLVPFIEGAPADATREEHRLAAARALGRLHRTGAGLWLGRRPRLSPLAELDWPPALVPPELEEWRAAIVKARAWAIGYVSRVAHSRRLPASVIHGDFFPGNVLVAGDRVVGVIDWEEARADWLTWDLANAIGTFCSADDDLDRPAGRRFIRAYRAAGGTASPRDDVLLVAFVRVKRILEVLRARTDREPRWSHQRLNLRSLDKLSERQL
jgi:Ser/Thr protein kinase RdoA (MazF antagonist)